MNISTVPFCLEENYEKGLRKERKEGMQYITGQHALNLPCSLLTCGDWHQSALQWDSPLFRDSADSVFGEYGIEQNVSIPEHTEKYNVANHIRALLDLLEIGKFSLAQGMNKDFICNDDYTEEIFSQVMLLSDSPNWSNIDRFMEKEYLAEWLLYKEKKNKPQHLSPWRESINTTTACRKTEIHMNDWQKEREQVIKAFLNYLNKESKDFILKDGIALLTCYGLDRFSEDIYLDSKNGNPTEAKGSIDKIVQGFCKSQDFSYHMGKDTDIVKQYLINYGNIDKSLKVEISFKRKEISLEEISVINGILVYNIDILCTMKIIAYLSHNRIGDLYDVIFVCKYYYDSLSAITVSSLRSAIEYTGIENFYRICDEQQDELIDESKFTEDFLSIYNKLDLLYDEKERELTATIRRKFSEPETPCESKTEKDIDIYN